MQFVLIWLISLLLDCTFQQAGHGNAQFLAEIALVVNAELLRKMPVLVPEDVKGIRFVECNDEKENAVEEMTSVESQLN